MSDKPTLGATDLYSLLKTNQELKARLDEYEVIEEDLANLKLLSIENEILRKTLVDQKIDISYIDQALSKIKLPVEDFVAIKIEPTDFDSLINASDKDIVQLIKKCLDTDLVYSLKLASQELRLKFLLNMQANEAIELNNKINNLGPTKLIVVQQAQNSVTNLYNSLFA